MQYAILPRVTRTQHSPFPYPARLGFPTSVLFKFRQHAARPKHWGPKTIPFLAPVDHLLHAVLYLIAGLGASVPSFWARSEWTSLRSMTETSLLETYVV